MLLKHSSESEKDYRARWKAIGKENCDPETRYEKLIASITMATLEKG